MDIAELCSVFSYKKLKKKSTGKKKIGW